MDFQPSEQEQDIRKLAGQIFKDLAPPESLPNFETPTDWHDRALWKALAQASLLGVGIAESYGGMGMGLIETCALLEEAGRSLAPAPLLPTLLLGAAPISAFGSEDQKNAILPKVASGDAILTAALLDRGARSPFTVATTANRVNGGWRIDGTKEFVPAASLASHIVVPAISRDGAIHVFVVDRHASGVRLEAQATTTGELEYALSLESVPAEDSWRLGAPEEGADILRWTVERGLAGLCATELGVADRALRMTAKYASTRKQFDKPIASFQAVAQRAADAYIDLEAMRLATQQAIWRLASGKPAARELAIAKFWTSEGGHRVCYAAQHLHGGIGVDTDYPLHRYYLRSRQLELTLGGAHTHLAVLGDLLAAGGD